MMKHIYYLLILLGSIQILSCNKDTSSNDLIDLAFGDAIDKIDDISLDWQETIKELEQSIGQKLDATLRGALSDFVQQSIASAGIEARCNYEFLRSGMKKDLIRLRNAYRKKVGLPLIAISPTPEICHIIPNSIVPDEREVVGVGYDLFDEDINAFVISNDSTKKAIDQYITFQSNYQFTLTLGGANGLPFSPKYVKIVLECATCTSNKVITEIPFNTPEVTQKLLPEFGGSGGSPFIDEPDKYQVKKISGLRIHYSNYINSIAVAWEEYGDPADTSRYKWSIYRGGSGGVDTVIQLDWDEYLKGYAGRSGIFIDQIKFQTNKREIGPFGGTGGQPFDNWNIGHIVGIHGRAGAYQQGEYLNALGVIVRE